ncbi:hypothetical protein AMJ40_04145 [candidate division TA06 bacterium DG_26]|uniref:PTS EIIA type-2 domain-containing protein n=1 Tax=candidate division TA06 bacterium DG_26 TaxID=1703771 RepID=A0A0S7WIJ1_UNCT6|nr:MAG: hypothetical protein AMJ40_04145 [candidate division TA06 bacterium DG_26]
MQLRKKLNLIDVFSIASGAMISSGLFVLPGLAYARAGPAVVISYFFAGLLAMTGALSIAELATAMPKAGGDYFFISRSLGPAIGTVSGLLSWFSLSLKSAFALAGMAAFASLASGFDIHIIAILLCLLFLAINMIGIKEASTVQVLLVMGLLVLMFLYVVRGVPAIEPQRLRPFTPVGVVAVFSTAGFVFVSYGGLLKIASIAEEIRDPGRTIPLGILLSLVVVSAFYSIMILVTVGVVGGSELSGTLTPISDGAAVIMGSWGRIALSVAAILAFVSTANAGIMSASRYPLALSRDRLLPASLGKINARFRTPHMSLLLTGLFMIGALLVKLDVLVKAASTVLILTYILANLSVIVLRESRLQNYQPTFRAPLYPWIQILGILGPLFLVFEMGRDAVYMSLGLVVCGLFVYWFYGRIRASREYALFHLIERIRPKELGESLETELRQVIRERDGITRDRFDEVVEESLILDIGEQLGAEEFFELVATAMSERLGINESALLRAFQNKERETSSAISPTLAIPHVIIEGEHAFDILLARSRKGVIFSEAAPAVRTIFVLVGTRDERNFHLRALAAIAQIVQDPRFPERWMAAKDEEALRDLVLLGKRRRDSELQGM